MHFLFIRSDKVHFFHRTFFCSTTFHYRKKKKHIPSQCVLNSLINYDMWLIKNQSPKVIRNSSVKILYASISGLIGVWTIINLIKDKGKQNPMRKRSQIKFNNPHAFKKKKKKVNNHMMIDRKNSFQLCMIMAK